MPGSPAIRTTWPSPSLAQAQRSSRMRELVLAPDQRREALPVQRLEAALGAAFALDPEGGERLGEALEALRAEIGQLEQPADQPARRLADHHAARRRERLQSRSEIGRLADHGLLARRAFADQLADHDQTGRDTDPRRERRRRRRRRQLRRPPRSAPAPRAPPARRRPRAPAASRSRRARHRPCTWRRGRPSARPPRRSSLDRRGSRAPMSSGSSRAASAVEPTRSQNSTVSCRRSASRGGAPETPASPRTDVSWPAPAERRSP